MADHTIHSAYAQVYNTLLDTAASLEVLKREGAEEGVEPHAGAAMHAVRFAVAVLYPLLPCQAPPPVPDDPQRLLDLAAHWRDAAFDLGEFAPEPALRLVRGEMDGEGTKGRETNSAS
ncbi:hypothetical protein JIX56_18480 [Streptomyces sp. CA-210063]|uniref:hypothetical protein n=1 Tax=Streptomyces sp. CA-210063 TaxID=2801029 RepID=UPI00214C3E04|nr:hypothetical protein [Streptomyces sp. CA-210063]UUU31733.1 hypothetical protein JIX56_18480 [Streptomyces sp. CA-210063]